MAGKATVGASELPTGAACPILVLVLVQEPLSALSRLTGLSEASCPSYPQWELLLYNLAVLQASCLCSFSLSLLAVLSWLFLF